MEADHKLGATETLRSIVEQADDAEEMERLLAQSPEDLAKELAAAGYDAARMAEETALLEKELLAEPRLSGPPVKHGNGTARTGGRGPDERVLRPVKSKRWIWLTAAAVLVACVSVAAGPRVARYFAHHTEVAPKNPTPREIAEHYRDQAVQACTAKQWGECETLLGEAFDLDPAGNDEPRVDRMRWAINQARLYGPDKPWLSKPMGPGREPAEATSGDKPTVAPPP